VEERLFEPDIMLPEQLSTGGKTHTRETGLILAILEEATNTYKKHRSSRSPEGSRLFREAAEWFASDSKEWPFSFESICDVLDIDPDWFREELEYLVNRDRRKRSPHQDSETKNNDSALDNEIVLGKIFPNENPPQKFRSAS